MVICGGSGESNEKIPQHGGAELSVMRVAQSMSLVIWVESMARWREEGFP